VAPIESIAQTAASRNRLLEGGTQMVIRINDGFNSADKTEAGIINAIVDTDVYSADGTQVLVKAGTPAFIEYAAEQNGAWGKAGKLCLTSAYTKTIDNKQVPLRLGSCKNGGSRLGGVIVLSVIFFPIGLISGLMKGTMPKISQGATFNASVMQDIMVD
ncbi:MAG: hypothetical protein K2G77_01120, partial [Muribaculaceae bacterium]|nr:hypothetical protein [Muribaculaceae bacterium]